MKTTITSSWYTIELTNKEMLAILNLDTKRLNVGMDEDEGVTLYDILAAVPLVKEIEYDGMFGANIFVHLETALNADGILTRIRKKIQQYIDEANNE